MITHYINKTKEVYTELEQKEVSLLVKKIDKGDSKYVDKNISSI